MSPRTASLKASRRAQISAGTDSGSGAGEGAQEAEGGDSGASSDEGKKKTKGGPTPYLNTEGLDASGFPSAIVYILAGLSVINIYRFPNATFDLLRTFLEKSIKAYAKLNEEVQNTATLTAM